MTLFSKIYRIVLRIPKGRVATYAQIAALLGRPRAARLVGMALRRLPEEALVPWQRVINSRGMISIENLAVPKAEQAERLQKEGVKVKLKDGNYWIDLEKYLWKY